MTIEYRKYCNLSWPTSYVRLIFLAFYFVVVCHENVVGQAGISVLYAPSKVIKHRDNLLFDVPNRSHEFRLAYTHQTRGEKDWQRYWGNPKIAINGVYVNFGDDDVLGSAFALLPEMHFTLLALKKIKFNMQFGTGVAYLTKPFDAISNPKNNAIGSSFNNTSSLKFGIEYKWSNNLLTSVSGGLVHFSNGLSSSPNSGINIFGLSLGVNYQLDSKQTENQDPLIVTRKNDPPDEYRRWIGDVQYHYGFTEHSTPGGPQYAVQAISLGLGYRYNRYMTAFLGGEFEYNDGVYIFFKRNFSTEEEAKKRAKKTVVYFENELRFGPVFNRLRVGFYLGWPAENTKTNYIKVMTGLYLPTIRNVAKPYVAVILKSHIAVADYLAIGGGVSF